MAIAITAIVACAATTLVVVFVAGLMGHEKKIAYEIQTLYSVADEQFRRSMGNLLEIGRHAPKIIPPASILGWLFQDRPRGRTSTRMPSPPRRT
jgi:hypothetical protein